MIHILFITLLLLSIFSKVSISLSLSSSNNNMNSNIKNTNMNRNIKSMNMNMNSNISNMNNNMNSNIKNMNNNMNSNIKNTNMNMNMSMKNNGIKQIIVSSTVAASLILSNIIPSQADDRVVRDITSVVESSSSDVIKRKAAPWNLFERLDNSESAIDEVKRDVSGLKQDVSGLKQLYVLGFAIFAIFGALIVTRSDTRMDRAQLKMDLDKKELNGRMDKADLKMNFMFVLTSSIAIVPVIKSFFDK